MYALGASLDVEMEASLLEFLLDGAYEGGNVAVAGLFGGIQFLLDVVVHLLFGVLEREVFQFGLQLVQAQFVGKRSIEVSRFVGYAKATFLVVHVANLTHEVHTVGNHDEDDAHVFGKGEEEVSEVLALDGRTLLVELVDAHQSVDDGGHVGAKVAFHLVGGHYPTLHTTMQHDGQQRCPTHTYLVGHNERCLHILHNGIESEVVARQGISFNATGQTTLQQRHVTGLQTVACNTHQLAVYRYQQNPFGGGKKCLFFHIDIEF